MADHGYFVGRVLVEHMDDLVCVREPYSFITQYGLEIVVPENFLSDGASVPRVLWSRFHPYDKRYFAIAIVHDYLYWAHLFSRETSDAVFLDGINASDTVRRIFYDGVRIGGEESYETGPARQEANRKRLEAMGLSVGPLVPWPGQTQPAA